MNRVYRTVWNAAKGHWQVAPETVKRQGKTGSGRSASARPGIRLAALAAGSLTLLPLSALANGLPTGGNVRAGDGDIEQSGNEMRIEQRSDRLAIDWDSFSIAEGNRVKFNQPGRDSAVLNRVTGDQLSQIRGAIEANGQVFLVNPNGIVFGDTAQVDVGGLVASTLDISPDEFMAGKFTFEGDSSSAIINQGNIRTADEGYVALIAAEITNRGSIKAPKGDVLMGAGNRVTLDMGGPVKIEVEEARLDTYIEQGGAIEADGGRVYLTAKAAGDLAASVINHTGVTQARTLAENEQGEIWLMGDMDNGETQVAGTLDASAPKGGDGGFVETSAAKVTIKDEATVTTRADEGQTGEWLIDPTNIEIVSGESGHFAADPVTSSTIGADALVANLADNNIAVQTPSDGNTGAGDITVSADVVWGENTQLTLNAINNINVNARIENTNTTGGGVLFDAANTHSAVQFDNNGKVVMHNVEQLQWVNSALDGTYELGSNIDASDTESWNEGAGFDPIGDSSNPFTGHFDGLGNQISGLIIDRPSENRVGLFGQLSNGSIKDVGLIDLNVRGNSKVGGFVGENDSGELSNVYATGNVGGWARVGGLVGDSESGVIKNAYSTASVSGTFTYSYAGGLIGIDDKGMVTNAYATGDVSGEGRVGGLVGTVNDGTITHSYATGNIVGEDHVGGLIGLPNSDPEVSVSYYATTDADGNAINQTNDSGLGEGKTFARLMESDTFTGWDLSENGAENTTWRIYEDNTTPLLRSFLTPLTVSPDNVTTVYDGQEHTATGEWSADQAYEAAHIQGVAVVSGAGTDVGSYPLELTGLYSNQQGYDLSFREGELTIAEEQAIPEEPSARETRERPNTDSVINNVLATIPNLQLQPMFSYSNLPVQVAGTGIRTTPTNNVSEEGGE